MMYLIPSYSKDGQYYKIRTMDGEEPSEATLRCSCPRFVFNDTFPCKHITDLVVALRTKRLKEYGIIEATNEGRK